MDILGREGEQASEAIRNMSQRLENLESRVNALDDALQDYEGQDSQLRQTVDNLQESFSGKVDEVMNLVEKILRVQQRNIEDIDRNRSKLSSIGSKASNLERRISDIEEKVGNEIEEGREERESIHNDILNLEKRLEQQEQDLNDKLEAEEFSARKNHVEREIKKLRSSVNYLADRFESEEIRVEKGSS
ncbi:hypothetical protein AQV86_02410 [Nanohaloarchaea archaeon SG9]|nr:hypothetical protein AQV86_02410 [Nanohaloarchaea archaeon SG9]